MASFQAGSNVQAVNTDGLVWAKSIVYSNQPKHRYMSLNMTKSLPFFNYSQLYKQLQAIKSPSLAKLPHPTSLLTGDSVQINNSYRGVGTHYVLWLYKGVFNNPEGLIGAKGGRGGGDDDDGDGYDEDEDQMDEDGEEDAEDAGENAEDGEEEALDIYAYGLDDATLRKLQRLMNDDSGNFPEAEIRSLLTTATIDATTASKPIQELIDGMFSEEKYEQIEVMIRNLRFSTLADDDKDEEVEAAEKEAEEEEEEKEEEIEEVDEEEAAEEGEEDEVEEEDNKSKKKRKQANNNKKAGKSALSDYLEDYCCKTVARMNRIAKYVKARSRGLTGEDCLLPTDLYDENGYTPAASHYFADGGVAGGGAGKAGKAAKGKQQQQSYPILLKRKELSAFIRLAAAGGSDSSSSKLTAEQGAAAGQQAGQEEEGWLECYLFSHSDEMGYSAPTAMSMAPLDYFATNANDDMQARDIDLRLLPAPFLDESTDFGKVIHPLHALLPAPELEEDEEAELIAQLTGTNVADNKKAAAGRGGKKAGKGGRGGSKQAAVVEPPPAGVLKKKDIAIIEFSGEDAIYWQAPNELKYISCYNLSEENEDDCDEDGRPILASGQIPPAIEIRRMFQKHAKKIRRRLLALNDGKMDALSSVEDIENLLKLLFPYFN